jgi:hypothetical protein
LHVQQPRHGLARQLPRLSPGVAQPVLECRVRRRDAVQEIAPVELHGRFQGRPLAPVDQAPEDVGIDDDGVGRQAHRLPRGLERRRFGPGERLAQLAEGLAQAGAGLGLAPVAPQKAGQLLARLGRAGRNGQIGEQGLGLAADRRD